MDLSALAGNSRLKELLFERGEGRGLAHAYIIAGQSGSGRHTLARLIATAMMCNAETGRRPCGKCAPCKKVIMNLHPDVVVVSGAGEGKPITVGQVRSLRADAYIRPNEGERKVYLLEEADQMNASSQNALLKLLEEGPKYAAFLLLCENTGGLLQTVRSRCEELFLVPVPLRECERWLGARFSGKDPEACRQAALECQGILGRAVERLEGTDEASRARLEQVMRLADALERGSELELFETAMVLDKLSREDLPKVLDGLEEELGTRITRSKNRCRLFCGVELADRLRTAARLNANAGQLAGWLCAGMFLES